MSNSIKSLLLFTIAMCLYSSAFTAFGASKNFTNPLLQPSADECLQTSINAQRFSSEVSDDNRIKICQAIEKVTDQLNTVTWSPAVSDELRRIWQIFSQQNVTIRLLSRNSPRQILAMAEVAPSTKKNSNFGAYIYLRPDKSDSMMFFPAFLHELRHVADFYDIMDKAARYSSLDLEKRAFDLMGKVNRETPLNVQTTQLPTFWKESWRKYSEEEITQKRTEAIDKYLLKIKYYRNLASNPQF